MLFQDRVEAGRLLAAKLNYLSNRPDVVVLALPRGGVPVGFEVAKALNAPLDVFVVRKLGVPGHEELAMGAIATGGVRVLNREVVQGLGIPEYMIDAIAAKEDRELERREREYRDGRPPIDVRGRTVVLVDDGLATGSSMRVAAAALRERKPTQIIVAVPVASPDTCAEFETEVDKIICGATPEPFLAVGRWYIDFSQTSDEEVRELLRQSANFGEPKGARPEAGRQINVTRETRNQETPVHIQIAGQALEGDLTIPNSARGVVLFAHGSGSSRHSPRNRYVAQVLQKAGFATLLMDLLTLSEERIDARTAALRFDIGLLARRLVGATKWLADQPDTAQLPIGYFGASTGAAAALVGAAELPHLVAAIVSRGGRPDLAGSTLRKVFTPVLLIVGGADETVLELNRKALALLPGERKLVVVPGATHLFEEEGALEEVARHATEWFDSYLNPARSKLRTA
jgi:putative phosphoribosyl transferase